MRVIYSLSAYPQCFKTRKNYKMEKCELWTAAISSLTRRCAGDKTVLYCDNHGAEYIRRIGFASIWDEVIAAIPDGFEGIDPNMFWAAGKLFALRAETAPLLMMDTDFIAWRLPAFGGKIIAAHTEDLSPNIYPPTEYFNMKEDYIFNKGYNYSAKPLNTAFLYLPDDELRRYYVNEAITFMKSAKQTSDPLCYMVYAEQRLLSMCAEYLWRKTETLIGQDKLFSKQENYTHLWGAKRVMRENPAEYARFREKCVYRIRSDFPDYEYVIEIIDKE